MEDDTVFTEEKSGKEGRQVVEEPVIRFSLLGSIMVV